MNFKKLSEFNQLDLKDPNSVLKLTNLVQLGGGVIAKTELANQTRSESKSSGGGSGGPTTIPSLLDVNVHNHEMMNLDLKNSKLFNSAGVDPNQSNKVKQSKKSKTKNRSIESKDNEKLTTEKLSNGEESKQLDHLKNDDELGSSSNQLIPQTQLLIKSNLLVEAIDHVRCVSYIYLLIYLIIGSCFEKSILFVGSL